MGRQSQRKGAEGERELQEILSAAGYPVRWGGNKTYGSVPDLTGLRGIHIEAKRCEQVRISHWMGQAAHDAAHFRDGAPHGLSQAKPGTVARDHAPHRLAAVIRCRCRSRLGRARFFYVNQ